MSRSWHQGLHGARPLCSARACAASPRKARVEPRATPDKPSKLPKWRTASAWQDNSRSTRATHRVPPERSGYNLLRPCNGVAKRAFARHAPARRSPPARPEVNMRKLATAVAVAFAALSAQAALACDEKVERAEQPQHKPAVAEKAQKQNKQQQKAKKAEASEKTAVARADK